MDGYAFICVCLFLVRLRSLEAVHGQHIREQEFTMQGSVESVPHMIAPSSIHIPPSFVCRLTGRLQQQQALCRQRDEDIQR